MSYKASEFGRHRQKQKITMEHHKSREIFGDILQRSQSKNNIRIVFQNVNGFGTSKNEETKKEIFG